MSRAQLGELRDAIAGVIAVEKAYNVPALCVRLGLDDGEVSEAMSSKARYASARLAKLPIDRLIAVARALLEETDDFALREVTDRIAERDTPPISDLTRRRLLSVYDGCEYVPSTTRSSSSSGFGPSRRSAGIRTRVTSTTGDFGLSRRTSSNTCAGTMTGPAATCSSGSG